MSSFRDSLAAVLAEEKTRQAALAVQIARSQSCEAREALELEKAEAILGHTLEAARMAIARDRDRVKVMDLGCCPRAEGLAGVAKRVYDGLVAEGLSPFIRADYSSGLFLNDELWLSLKGLGDKT